MSNREIECQRREPELITRLEDIMFRVVDSQKLAVIDNSEVWSTAKAETQNVEFECDICGNKVYMSSDT